MIREKITQEPKSRKLKLVILITLIVSGVIIFSAYIFFVRLGKTTIIPPVTAPKDQEVVNQNSVVDGEEDPEGIRQQPVPGQR